MNAARMFSSPCIRTRLQPGLSPALEFVRFGLTVKYRLTTALARLRERGNRELPTHRESKGPRRTATLAVKFGVCWALVLLFPQFLPAQFSVNDLPKLGAYESERASSYDRSGGNGDYRTLKAGET